MIKKFKYTLPLLLAVAMCLGMFIGLRIGGTYKPGSMFYSKVFSYNKLNDLINYIEQSYVDTVDENKLVDKSIYSILEQLDPHSAYIPAEDLGAANEPLEGNFEGIGVEFQIVKDTVLIMSIIPGGPSERAGLQVGDRLIAVEKDNITGKKLNSDLVLKKLRGRRDTKVNVSILRPGTEKTLPFVLSRGRVPILSIDASYMVEPGIGYIKIARFGATTYEEFINALDRLIGQGMGTLVLDLRENTGGYLKAATDIADEFLSDKQMIVYTEGRNQPRDDVYATEKGTFEKGNLYVLIDDETASASEILAGALQDNDRAMIIGRRSFGKGLVQEQTVFPDGSALRLTIARYYTPTGRSIQKPYENGNEEYYHEVSRRYKSGEFSNADSVKQSDTTRFVTKGGRVLYGHGGITPDVFVAIDTSYYTPFLSDLLQANLIAQYALQYLLANKNVLSKYPDYKAFSEKFGGSHAMYGQFMDKVSKQAIKGSKKEQAASANYIRILLKAYLAKYLYGNNYFYISLLENDRVFKKTINLITKENKKALAQGTSASPLKQR